MKTFKFNIPMNLSIEDFYSSEEQARLTLGQLLNGIKNLIDSESELLEEKFEVSFGDATLESTEE